MGEVLTGIESVINYPVQNLLVAAALVVGIIWFIKFRPIERQEKMESEKRKDDVLNNLVEVIQSQKVMIAECYASYDKIAEHSISIIDNNNATLQVILHNLEMFTRTLVEKINQDDHYREMYNDKQTELLKTLHDMEIIITRLLEKCNNLT